MSRRGEDTPIGAAAEGARAERAMKLNALVAEVDPEASLAHPRADELDAMLGRAGGPAAFALERMRA